MNGYDAQDMATQGADGFRDGYQAGYADAAKAFETNSAQQPIAEIAWSDDGYKIGLLGPLRAHRFPIGTKLYAAPVAAAPVDLSDRYNVILSAMMARRPEGHTFANTREIEWMAEGVHAALVATPAVPGTDLGQFRALTEACEDMRAASEECDIGEGLAHAVPFHLWNEFLSKLDAAQQVIDAIPAAPGIDRDVVEKAAIELWHRWGGESVLEWEDETHKAEYRLAAEAVLALIDASPKGGSDAEVMQLRYQLNSLRQLLSGFDVAVQKNPLQPPCTYLEEVRLSHEFQPGEGQKVAAALRNALNSNSEGAKP